MPEYPRHLCPLCKYVLRIADNKPINATQIEVKVECDSAECPFSEVYTIGITDIRQYGRKER